MTSESIIVPDRAAARVTRRAASAFPVLDREPRALGRRLAVLPGKGHPVWTYLCGIVLALATIAGFSILAGIFVTRLLIQIHGVAHDDEALVSFFARHRSSGLTEASLVGSIIAGGVVLPIVAGVGAVVAAALRQWRVAAFLPFALGVESGSYRATTLAVHRHRPTVHRLEQLDAHASYPSGHTAASIAVYGGIAFLVSSRLASRKARVAVWTVALLIPVYVGFARMYRGMHHPLDVAGGVIIGVLALSAIVLVSRASSLAARVRQ